MALISDVVANTTIDPSWGNSIRNATVQVTTSGARPAAPAEGMVIYETDTDRLLAYDGSAWQRVGWGASGGRTGCTIRRNANQSVNSDSRTAISFDAEDADTDAFFAPTSTTVTIPSGLGGLYTITLSVSSGSQLGTSAGAYIASAGSANQIVATGAGSNDNMFPLVSSRYYIGCAMTVPLAAADTITAGFYHNIGLAINVTARLTVYRIGI